ncbi:sensor histidine kinase [Chitinophaga sp. HK235]|uniref:sensor histidine kinase n=1 Tax=Chitinophaga sp. HK235 TaxID=2952571 RepID=UPI001BAD705D|nr:sensor histidine kinase [Chitinophaga sp. HK235]
MNLLENINKFHKEHRIPAHLFFWLGVLLLSTGERNYYYREDWFSLQTYAYNGLTLLTQALTSYLLAYLVIPLFFRKKQYLTAVLLLLSGMYAICILSRIITVYLQEPLSGTLPKAGETLLEIVTNVSKLWHVYFFRNFSVAVVFLFLKLLKDQQFLQQRSLLMEKGKAAAELQLLRNQLQPHFLFNTLNNIYALSFIDNAGTSESIGRLSDMLDYILYRCNQPFVKLSEEVDLLHNYIALQALRYDKRLQVGFTASGHETALVAPLLLLTLVENAFKHGVTDNAGHKKIDIVITVAASQLHCQVQNTCAVAAHNGGKIGLHNLRQQLELIYPEKHNLAITTTEGLFTVTLTIQL